VRQGPEATTPSPPPAPPPYDPPPAPRWPNAPRYPYATGPGPPGGGFRSYRPGPAPGVIYAGFWIRFAAYLVDYVPLSILAALTRISGVTSSCSSASGVSICTYEVNGTGLGITTAVLGVYWILTWSLLGGSLGQRALGLRVVNAADGRPISLARAAARFVGYVVSVIPFAIGLIWAGFDHQKQGWHDKIAGTFVVRAA
jgi:uncharacterized RDD family membrane protein YckC